MRRLTLSFDNGPSPEVTPELLDLLRDRDLRARFFVCGKGPWAFLSANPFLVSSLRLSEYSSANPPCITSMNFPVGVE